jgi:hypothetical protein
MTRTRAPRCQPSCADLEVVDGNRDGNVRSQRQRPTTVRAAGRSVRVLPPGNLALPLPGMRAATASAAGGHCPCRPGQAGQSAPCPERE